jgi:hypothetical protein
MLLEFTVKNFLSFKDEVTLSLRARDTVTGHEEYNTFLLGGQPILKTVVIYGANASGKSNLIKAMAFMKQFVIGSLERKREKNREIDIDSFKFNTGTLNAPSEFETVFVYQDIYYRYGFVLDKQRVHREWLYYAPAEKEIKLFERTFEKGSYTVKLGRTFKEGKLAVEKQATREDALLLAVVAQSVNGEISRTVMEWFTSDLNVLFATKEETFEGFTYRKLGEPAFKHDIQRFLEAADTSVEDIELVKANAEDIPKGLPEPLRKLVSNANLVVTKHTVRDGSGNVTGAVLLSLNEESEGTQKLFALSGPIIQTLRNGETLIVDELDSKLHPLMMRFLVNLFNSPERNPYHAQLVFVTHDTNLLTSRFFRTDQIWFIEKNAEGVSDLYSLVHSPWEIDGDNEAYRRDYFQGKYAAIPVIETFNLFSGESHGQR